MTALPQTAATTPVRVTDLRRMKAEGQRIVMTTCYDTLFARLLDDSGVDLLLVGDSVAEVLNGASSTLAATLDQMIYHAAAVCRGVRRALVVCDLPFLSYHVSVPSAIANAGRVMQETGCAAVKLEGGRQRVETIRCLVEAGIPVMGHLGLTPQSIHVLGGHRVQGRDEAAAQRLEQDVQSLQQAGAFALVLELVPAPLATRIATQLEIPVIGIGAGPGCDGQVLVLHDLLGLTESFHARFVKRYATLSDEVRRAVRQYAIEVRDGSFPALEHSFYE
jgi:3-methyl-2-oxobutanoate hydroxymethyltransferase